MRSILVFTYLILLAVGAHAWPPGPVAEIMLQANPSIPVNNLSDPTAVFQHYRNVLFKLRNLEDARDQALEFFIKETNAKAPRRDVDFSKRFVFEAQTELNQFRLEQNLPPDTKLTGTLIPVARTSNVKTYSEIRNSMLQVLNYNLVRHHRARFFEGDPQGDFLNYLNNVFKKQLTDAIVRSGFELTHPLISNVERQIGRIHASYLFYLDSKTNNDFQEMIKTLLEIESHYNLRVDLHGFWKGLWIEFKIRTDRLKEFIYARTNDLRQNIVALVESRKADQQAQMCIQLFQ